VKPQCTATQRIRCERAFSDCDAVLNGCQECSGSVCLMFDLESCQCQPSMSDDFDDQQLCQLCCMRPNDLQSCRLMLHSASGVATISCQEGHKSYWVFTLCDCRHSYIRRQTLYIGQSTLKKNKLLQIDGARAPVPHSWRRQCTQQYWFTSRRS